MDAAVTIPAGLPSIERLGGRRPGAVAIAYSTKDRGELTRRTIEAFAKEPRVDLFWVDGSAGDDGRALPGDTAHRLPGLREIHRGVRGGADAAIVHALTTMLDRGYEHLGLCENDVLLADGWLDAIMGLFEAGRTDGWEVGAVSARCYRERMLFQRRGFAVMFNLGAGMVLLTRAAAQAILARYRTVTFLELKSLFASLADRDISTTWEMRDVGPRLWGTADWFFDASLALEGLASLALTPAMATNIDGDLATLFGIHDVTEHGPPVPDEDGSVLAYRERLGWLRRSGGSSVLSAGHVAHRGDEQDGHLVFAHQIAAALPQAVSGPWRLRWQKCFGPFVWVAEGAGARVELSVVGRWLGLLVGRGPGGGRLLVEVNGTRSLIDLERPERDIASHRIDIGNGVSSRLVIEAHGPGCAWHGLQTDQPQPWLPLRSPFARHSLPQPLG